MMLTWRPLTMSLDLHTPGHKYGNTASNAYPPTTKLTVSRVLLPCGFSVVYVRNHAHPLLGFHYTAASSCTLPELTYTDHAVLATPTGCSHGAGYTTSANSSSPLHFHERRCFGEDTSGSQRRPSEMVKKKLSPYRNPCWLFGIQRYLQTSSLVGMFPQGWPNTMLPSSNPGVCSLAEVYPCRDPLPSPSSMSCKQYGLCNIAH